MNLKTQFKHRIKMTVAAVIRFVVAHPRLLAVGMFIGLRIPPVKRFLTHVHITTNLSVVTDHAASQSPIWVTPQSVPLPARAAYLQLIAGRQEH